MRRKAVVLFAALLSITVLLFVFNSRKQDPPVVEKADQQSIPVAAVEQPKGIPALDKLLEDPRLGGATTAISVRHAETGELLYTHQGNVRVHPASVMKLLTGAAALDVLGEEYRFQTEVYAYGEVEKNVLKGDLYVKGKGDPTLVYSDLEAFALKLKQQGIQSITGNIYGDDTWYDTVRLSQDLNWSDEPFYTGAQVSALTLSPNGDYDAGTVIVDVQAGKKAGQAGRVTMLPQNDYLTIVNETKTVAKGGVKSITVERKHGTNTLVVTGTIPIGKKSRFWSSVWEPTDYVLHMFQRAVESQGIHFGAPPAVKRGAVPKNAVLVSAKQSIPLKELFVPFMKLSNNGHAEVLVKDMGRGAGLSGSWDHGLKVMSERLAAMGIDTKNMLLRDGSGMSHKNLVTADEVTKLLFEVQSQAWFKTFYNSLPVAGQEERLVGGTLRHRMKGTAAAGKVHAKTGALKGVTALSGYVDTKGGDTLIFSIMLNNYLDETINEVVDQMAIALANVD
ncbi:D-alanyl-D-alanine carboxypeptidase/D-alanyl-D-alanine-endopeptidase [Sporosarcina sp. HYO08]|uniref:D-alanyl-D-alanine carboxypeptidase/D-alanyl-D-alanine endopeptidase n=1 Tax=Sporosarcina sp. HYO08 TaxID=1759557 RepID=UPI00079C3F54|nr:D-alanyl-D-alanine carboxypeptidase/D-alanyl-D-alanine-endopeptidase [Sporosarcina sp. HYO08]KXH80673.1 D-alanyl-D-alanine carboxypeptidase [Sporosarcina sp. HYO08]